MTDIEQEIAAESNAPDGKSGISAKDHPDVEILNTNQSKKLAEKLYYTFIDPEDLRRFPAFLLTLDRLLQDFGGRPMEEIQEEREEQEKSSKKASKPSHKQDAGDDSEEDDQDDEDESDDDEDRETAAGIRLARQDLLVAAEESAAQYLQTYLKGELK